MSPDTAHATARENDAVPDAEMLVVEVVGRFRVNREAWRAMTLDDQASEVHSALHDVSSWTFAEVETTN